jgi:predicted nucleic acid-binding protein
MDFHLLDTNVISVLFDARRSNHASVRAALAAIDPNDPQYVSVVVMAELRYGMEAATLAGQDITHIRQTLEQADHYPLAETNRHTAEAYADIKARLAHHWLDLSRRPPRWVEDWKDRASSKTLQIDENDLWIVAQTIERNYNLVTTDRRMVDRFAPALPELRYQLI